MRRVYRNTDGIRDLGETLDARPGVYDWTRTSIRRAVNQQPFIRHRTVAALRADVDVGIVETARAIHVNDVGYHRR